MFSSSSRYRPALQSLAAGSSPTGYEQQVEPLIWLLDHVIWSTFQEELFHLVLLFSSFMPENRKHESRCYFRPPSSSPCKPGPGGRGRSCALSPPSWEPAAAAKVSSDCNQEQAGHHPGVRTAFSTGPAFQMVGAIFFLLSFAQSCANLLVPNAARAAPRARCASCHAHACFRSSGPGCVYLSVGRGLRCCLWRGVSVCFRW